MIKRFASSIFNHKRSFSATSIRFSTKGTKFDDRESAAENKYAREHDQELLKKLRKEKESKEKSKKNSKKYTTDSWYVSRLTPNPEYCPMLMEIELLAIMGIIGVALNLIMTALISKCRENIKLDVETSAINVGVMIVLTIYLLTLFDSVCEATDCAEFRRVVLIVLSQIYMIGNTIFPIVYYHFQFNAQIADQSALKENLQQVFNNVQLKAQFKEFLVSEFSVENFLFLEAIKKLKKKFEGEVDLNLIRQGIQEVYDSFFKKDASNALNVSHVVSKLLKMQMQDLQKMSGVDMLSIYDEAYSEIALLVESDSLRRFMIGKDGSTKLNKSNNFQGLKSAANIRSTANLVLDQEKIGNK